MYCYRPISALTSQQIEGALPLKNASARASRPIPDPLLVRGDKKIPPVQVI